MWHDRAVAWLNTNRSNDNYDDDSEESSRIEAEAQEVIGKQSGRRGPYRQSIRSPAPHLAMTSSAGPHQPFPEAPRLRKFLTPGGAFDGSISLISLAGGCRPAEFCSARGLTLYQLVANASASRTRPNVEYQLGHNMLHRIWAGLCAGLVTLALQSSCPAAPQYKLLDLGSFGGFSLANDINESGQVVGQSRHPDGRVEAFRTQPNSPINAATDGLGDIGGGDPQDSYAEAVNDLGQVIGAGFHAAFTLADGVFGPASDMGTLGGQYSFGVAINNRGQLAGAAGIVLFDNQFHGFRTSGLRPINPATDDLGTLGGPSSDAQGINSLGQVVGGSSLPGGVIYHAYRTAPDAAINPATDDLGGLGGDFCAASAINDVGQVVGAGFLPNGDEHAFRTAPGAAINPLTDDLGTLGLRRSRQRYQQFRCCRRLFGSRRGSMARICQLSW